MKSLDWFKLTPDDAGTLADFRLVISNVDLETINLADEILRTLQNRKGVYFWMMRYGEIKYKIYVGKTNSLPRRLREYRNKFQPGVPNDYKMRHFQAWARENLKDSELDLYFVEAEDNTTRETEVWRRTNPLMNERAEVSQEALQSAHWEYYKSRFEKLLVEDSRTVVGVEAIAPEIALRPIAVAGPVKTAREPAAGGGIARARERFAELGAFRRGTNEAVIYDLLQRDGGATLDECRLACRNPNRASSIITDLCDVASITQRNLVKTDHCGVMHYSLER
jgi:hypothetical protein